MARGRITIYRSADGLPNDDIQTVLVDHGGVLWLGSRNGLARFDGERFVTLPSQPALVGGATTLFEDRDGAIWAGGRDGVVVWRDGRPHPLALPEKDEQGAVVQILRDRDGALWVRTETHICRVEAVTEGAGSLPGALRLRYIGPGGDLAYSMASTSQQPAAWATRSGLLWFASFKGLVSVNPRTLQAKAAPPPGRH